MYKTRDSLIRVMIAAVLLILLVPTSVFAVSASRADPCADAPSPPSGEYTVPDEALPQGQTGGARSGPAPTIRNITARSGITLTPSSTPVIYDCKPLKNGEDFIATSTGAPLEFSYRPVGGGAFVAGTPVNAGTYELKASPGYAAGEQTIQVTIEPRSLNDSRVNVWLNRELFFCQPGKTHIPNILVELDGIGIGPDQFIAGGTTQASERGDYTISVTGINNFKDSLTLDWQIRFYLMTVYHKNVSLVYDGQKHAADVTVIDPSDALVSYSLNPDGPFSPSIIWRSEVADSGPVYFRTEKAGWETASGPLSVNITPPAHRVAMGRNHVSL